MPTYYSNHGTMLALPPDTPPALAAEYLRQAQLPPYKPSQEWRTKDGRIIAMEFHPMDPEDTRGVNKGYVVRRVNAYVEGVHAGYLKISYVPKERVPECYPTPWHWLTALKGWCFDASNLRDCWVRAHHHAQKVPVSLRGQGIASNALASVEADEAAMQADLDALADSYIYSLDGTPKEALAAFIKRSVDYAFVDHIRVFKGKTAFGQEGPTEINWRRQGIATAMYNEGARWMAETYGLALHGSSLQSEEADGVWLAMMKAGKYPIATRLRPDGRAIYMLDYRSTKRTTPTIDGPLACS